MGTLTGPCTQLACLLVISLQCSLLVSSISMDSMELPRSNYDSMLMKEFYKRLYGDNSLDLSDLSDVTEDLALEYPEPEIPAGHQSVRDSELIEHSSNAASNQMLQQGDGLDESLSVKPPMDKPDDSLPFNCPPPNPSPKGYTSEDGCRMDVDDTAEAQKAWITALQDEGYCTCDREHMEDCPDLQSMDNGPVKKSAGQNEPVYLTGEKRVSLVAKKSPRSKRSVQSGKERHHSTDKKKASKKHSANPYLQGERLRTVAKKG